MRSTEMTGLGQEWPNANRSPGARRDGQDVSEPVIGGVTTALQLPRSVIGSFVVSTVNWRATACSSGLRGSQTSPLRSCDGIGLSDCGFSSCTRAGEPRYSPAPARSCRCTWTAPCRSRRATEPSRPRQSKRSVAVVGRKRSGAKRSGAERSVRGGRRRRFPCAGNHGRALG